MKFIVQILKGSVMGIANVIPGVSGGTMAVSMGIYDTLIHAITHLFKEFKKSFMSLLPIGLGMIIGIVGLSFLIDYMFGVAPMPTNLLFIGLILGGLPALKKRFDGAKFNPGYLLGFLLFFAMVIVLAFLDGTEGAAADLSMSFLNGTKLFLVGVVAAATMVIPGVSGSMMLMLMGYYEPVITTVKDFVLALKDRDVAGITDCLFVIACFGIGVVVGIFAIAKLIEILLIKFPYMVFSCILGLIVGSPFAIVILNKTVFMNPSVLSIVISVLCLAVGFMIAFLLDRLGAKQDAQKLEANS